MSAGPGRWWRALRGRPRLCFSVLVGTLAYLLLPPSLAMHAEARVLVGWNVGAWLYLLLVLRLMWADDPEGMRKRALRQDDGRYALLALVVLAAAAVLLAVGSQLAVVKNMTGLPRTLHIALAALTVLSSWLFTQVLFALHYAHDFYLARLRPPPGLGGDVLIFPGTPNPVYRDFVYFACVIGTSGQTADVSFNGSLLRGVGTAHCVLAFFFNATLLALTINIAAGLL